MSYDGDYDLDTETKRALRKVLKNTEGIVSDEIHGSQLGSDYYRIQDKIGVIDTATGLNQNPITSSINRYYDESVNLNVLVPALDPFNIANLSRDVKNSIAKNDFSESYLFSADFDKNEIIQRFRERKTLRSKLLEYYRINKIKQKHPMEQLIGLDLMILDKLDNILRYSVKQYILDKFEKRPQGKPFYTKTNFIATENTTKIVFTDESKVKDRPSSGMNWVNFPSTELFSLTVKCDSGGPITIGLNESDTNYETYIEIKAGEEYRVEEDSALIKSLNIRANSNDAVVRLIGLY